MPSINFNDTKKNSVDGINYLFNTLDCPDCKKKHVICITDSHGPSLLMIKKDPSRSPKDAAVTTSIRYAYKDRDNTSGKEKAYLPVKLPCSSAIVPFELEGVPSIGVKTFPPYERREIFE